MRTILFRANLICCALLLSIYLQAQNQPQNLEFFLARALEGNPLLVDLQHQIGLNRADSLLFRATYRPQLSANGGLTYAPVTRTQGGWGYDPALSNIGTLSTLASLSQTLVRRQDLQTQLAATSIQNQSVVNSGRLAVQDIRRNVTAQYITAFGDAQQLAFNRDLLRRLQDEAAILKEMTGRGTYRQTDYLVFLTTVQQQEALVRQLAVSYRNDLAGLRLACGIVDTSAADLAAPELVPAPAPAFAESGFAQQYRLDSLLLQNRDSLVDIPYRPRLAWSADAGFNTSFVNDWYRHFGLSVGATVTVPIYDGGQRRLQHDKIAIGRQTNAAYRDFAARQYNQQLLQLYQQLNDVSQLFDFQKNQIVYAEALLEADRRLLRTGDARIADYLLAINNFLTVQNSANQYAIARLQIINQINYWNLKQ